MAWRLLLLLILIWKAAAAEAAPAPVAKPSCPEACGNVSILYPFGIGADCSFSDGFSLTCNETNDPPLPFLGDYDIYHISLEGYLKTTTYVGVHCYDDPSASTNSSMTLTEDGPLTFSDTRNVFVAIGCDTSAYITGSSSSGLNYTSGCLSFCWKAESVVNDSCTGIGCCQSCIPSGIRSFNITTRSSYNHSRVSDFNPCSYAFLIDRDQFNYNILDLFDSDTYRTYDDSLIVPTVLDWAIGNESCDTARRNVSDFACKSENSDCYDSENGKGYRCNCSHGYQGSPYLEGGCTDIKECDDKSKNDCIWKCNEMPGSYNCSCPDGNTGNGRRNGTGCKEMEPKAQERSASLNLIETILGFGLGLLFLILACSWTYWMVYRRKIQKLKEKFFEKNGGILLQQHIISHGDVSMATKIFSAEELKKATNNYNESQVIGHGGSGTVYKGILPDQTTVAIKKSLLVDENQIEQFINEVFILSQINHRNIVKLLGCCLETEVPLLVYEFISNGTLFHHIHDHGHQQSSLHLQSRLRIASETAGALAYLHSAASIPIFHRDVKSTNILLDDNLTAKVSDFGASRLVPLDKMQVTTLVQGTLGYLDPEYFHTGQLTEKSDVYSFGVVLVELLTGKLPICPTRALKERNLSAYFMSSMNENRLFSVLEEKVRSEGNVEQLIEISQLAMKCLRIKGEERPTMKDVAIEIEGLRRFIEHHWAERNQRETQYLLGGEPVEEGHIGRSRAFEQDSLGNCNISGWEIGR